MQLALPDLDTRRFEELVLEGRSLVPAHASAWTDHNFSDPGIALIELLAALVEADVYRLNRVPDRNRRKLLSLTGERLRAPAAGRAVVAAVPGPGAPTALPAGLELSIAHGDAELAAVTLAELPLGAAAVAAVQTLPAGGAAGDVTARLATSGIVEALGDDPEPDSALAVGLDAALNPGDALTLFLDLEGPAPGEEDALLDAGGLGRAHHGASTAWEVFDGTRWHAVPDAGLVDETRALSRPGVVSLTAPVAAPQSVVGAVARPLAWVRCRLVSGRPDRAPALRAVIAGVAAVELAAPHFSSLEIEPGAALPPTGTVVAGQAVPLAFDLDADSGRVSHLVAGPDLGVPDVAVLDYAEPSGGPGRLVVEAAWLGHGDGTPEQAFELAGAPMAGGAAAWMLEAGAVTAVRLRDDLDASGRRDLDATLDHRAGELCFGDGRHGRVPPAGSAVLAAWRSTSAGAATALHAPASIRIAGGARNRRLLGDDPSSVNGTVSLRLAAGVHGGSDGDDVPGAAARLERRLWCHERLVEALERGSAATLDELDAPVVASLAVPERAVTLADHERIALATPGTRITRARAWADVHPGLGPGLRAAGCVTVVVVPRLPLARPEPTAGLLEAVWTTLAPRRMVGTRVFVTGPAYVTVDVKVSVALVPGADAAAATSDVRGRLERFLHPLEGGPGGRGWPFGRDVYRSEAMQVADGASLVDHVEELTLAVAGEAPTCGNLCVPATALAVAGSVDVEVAP